MLFPISHFFSPFWTCESCLAAKSYFIFLAHFNSSLYLCSFFFVHWKKMTHSCRAIWSGFKAVRLNVELKLITRFMKEINDFSVLFRQRTLLLKKKNSPKVERFTFPPLFSLFNLSPSLTSEWAGRSLLLACAPFFFTGDWSPPALGSILTRSSCFVSRIFLILLMQTELLSSAVHRALGSRAWTGQLFPSSFFFFFEHLPDPGKKGQRNPLNPWMDSHQRRMRLRERQRGIQGDGGWRMFWE